jgi:exoribonuclease-2
MEKYWCLRWIEQEPNAKTVYVRHLKEGMSRVEPIPLHLPIPELATHLRMTRAKVVIDSIDLLQLSASVRVLELESIEKVSEQTPDTAEPVEASTDDANPS